MTGILLIFAVLFASFTTIFFFYGAWVLIRHPHAARERARAIARALRFSRDERNPIFSPGQTDWEAEAVFNPAAVEVDGVTHLFYRAIGKHGVSRVGHAVSNDDGTFSRDPYPVFALSDEGSDAAFMRSKVMARHEALVRSGGSWAGTEDPRAVVIDDTLYLTFSAFGGWDSLRVGVTSLPVDDLRAGRWHWTPPVYLSPRGQVHKNWVLFPEKIHDKFAVLHSLHSGSRDHVLIDYLDTLDEEPSEGIHSPYLPVEDTEVWDSMVRGVGPPPIKTPHGWLVLYHANDHREPSRYKIGAMLLDLDDPTKVLARSRAPVHFPDAEYENTGAKPGIVYACGAIGRDGILTLYYGAADYVVCVAHHSLDTLLSHLLEPSEQPKYPSVPLLKLPVIA